MLLKNCVFRLVGPRFLEFSGPCFSGISFSTANSRRASKDQRFHWCVQLHIGMHMCTAFSIANWQVHSTKEYCLLSAFSIANW